MNIHTVLTLGTAIARSIGLSNAISVRAVQPVWAELYPHIADTSHASWPAAEFFQGYFTAKSEHNIKSWLEFFNHDHAVYYDATLGEGFTSWTELYEAFTELSKSWPENASSYPLRILGDTDSAVVLYVDTPGLFGTAEIRSISAVDFRDGKVTRQTDYWDGRRNPDTAGRTPDSKYPENLGLDTVKESAAPEMIDAAHRLNAVLSAGNAEAATALFSYDAVFEDTTLRTREEGKAAIGCYLQRALAQLPYGPGTAIRHVLGNVRGGGYEWQTQGQPTRNGITAVELDGDGLITRLTTVWDGSRISDSAMDALVILAVEK